MSLIGLSVPKSVQRALNQLKVPGSKEGLDDYHITLCYLPEARNNDIIAAGKVLHELSKVIPPFPVKTRVITCFPKGDDGVPVICKVDPGPIMEVRGQLIEALDEAGVNYSKKFPTYQPHITLAYSKENELGPFEWEMPEVVWEAGELILWGGDTMLESPIIHFPLVQPSLGERVAARFRRPI